MGKGIDLARPAAPELTAFLDEMKDQLLIVFLKELRERGHSLRFEVSQVDDTGGDLLMMSIEDNAFVFELGRKS